MKKIISTDNAITSDVLLLVLRIGAAALMLTHGLPKMMMLLGDGPVQFLPAFGMSAETSLMLTVFAEVACSILLLVGAATRLAVIPLIITMLVAAFLVHSADPFAKKELAIIYLLIYSTLLVGGSGKYSIDSLLQRNKKASKQRAGIEDSTLLISQ